MRVTTESGSVYVIDTDAQTMRRLPAEGGSQLQGDGHELSYEAISEIKVGKPVIAMWYRSPDTEVLTARLLTRVVLIEEELI